MAVVSRGCLDMSAHTLTLMRSCPWNGLWAGQIGRTEQDNDSQDCRCGWTDKTRSEVFLKGK